MFPGAVRGHRQFMEQVDWNDAQWDIALAGMHGRVRAELEKREVAKAEAKAAKHR